MGFNSVLFICNDAMDQIDNDPIEWWRKTKQALMSRECSRGETVEYGFGSHANGFRAVWNGHADYGVLIAAGGNFAQVVGDGYQMWKHNDPEVLKRLLEKAANKKMIDAYVVTGFSTDKNA